MLRHSTTAYREEAYYWNVPSPMSKHINMYHLGDVFDSPTFCDYAAFRFKHATSKKYWSENEAHDFVKTAERPCAPRFMEDDRLHKHC